MLGQLKTRSLDNNPRNSVWVVDEQRVNREQDAQLDDDNSIWRVINPGRRNARGYNIGYIVESHANADPLLKGPDFKRARFIGHNLWVTAYDPDERYAAGDTPNQNPGEPGLPQYIQNNQSLVNTRHRAVADHRFPSRAVDRGLSCALARDAFVRDQAGAFLRPQPGARFAPGAVRGRGPLRVGLAFALTTKGARG